MSKCISSILIVFFLFISFQGLNGQSKFIVEFKSGDLLPVQNAETFGQIDTYRNNELTEGRYYRYLQFDDIPTQKEIDYLEKSGVTLLSYISGNAYIASVNQNVNAEAVKSQGLRAHWKIEHERKAHPDIQNQALPYWCLQGNKAKLALIHFEDLDQEFVKASLLSEDIMIIEANGYNNSIIVEVNLDRVKSLTDLPFVEYIDLLPAPSVKDDRRGRNLHRVNRLNSRIVGSPQYTGEGVNVLVRDDGAIFRHIDFVGRINQDNVGPTRGDHGDGVGGIIAGAGNLNPLYQGMAYGSNMYVSDYQATFLDETMSLFFNDDVIVTNSSYSNGCNDGYTFTARNVDQQTFDNPTLMHVFSAGNDGIENCGYGAGEAWGNITGGHKQGKNVIATANTDFQGNIMASSSRGPAYDGRIKPDIAANGFNHVSTIEEQGYEPFGGTSAAAPVVAGVMAMLHEAYNDLKGDRANGGLLKAIMLNSATEAGNKGPDFIYGWGLLDANRALKTIQESRFEQRTIGQGEAQSLSIEIPEGVDEVRIMTYWPDTEANAGVQRSLINDINTSLQNSQGNTFMPWVLDGTPDPLILNLPAEKGIDDVNNMEQIAIDKPQAGTYTLAINGDQIPLGDLTYYVVWEFISGIEVTFPTGGENVFTNALELIHWDAAGNEGEFTLTYIHGDGEEEPIAVVNGNQRKLQWRFPGEYDENARIKIARGNQESTGERFLLGDRPESLNLNYTGLNDTLSWSAVDGAVGYNIYLLGEKYMEVITSSEINQYEFPDLTHRNSWVSVSAVFPEGHEGLRSQAIATSLPPSATITNNVDDMPCKNKPVTFETDAEGFQIEYIWKFGNSAIPEEVFTEGPHIVIFTEKGTVAPTLTVKNDAGEAQDFTIMTVIEAPENGNFTAIDLLGGEYIFEADVTNAESFNWDFGNGDTAEGENINYSYSESGTYEVTLVASNHCGSITRKQEIFVDVTTSVEEINAEDFMLSPNPNNGSFSLTIPDLEGNDLNIQVISMEGKTVQSFSYKNPSKGEVIQISGLSSGIFTLNLLSKNKILNKRVVVR